MTDQYGKKCINVGCADDTPPIDAEYLLGSASDLLPESRTVTETDTVKVDKSVPKEFKLNVPDATAATKGVIQGNGDPSTFLNGELNWTSPGGGGPETVYEIDWSSEPSSGPLADGPFVTSDGRTWTVVNSANATQFEIVNGQGLVITAAVGLNRNMGGGISAFSNAPYIRAPLIALSPECGQYTIPISLWSYISSYTLETTNNSIVSGVGSPATPYTAQTYAAALIRTAANTFAGGRRGTSGIGVAVTPIGASNVLVWRSLQDTTFDIFTGEWAGNWPEASTLKTEIVYGSNGFQDDDLFRQEFAEIMIGVETRTTTAAANPSATIARTRIQVG